MCDVYNYVCVDIVFICVFACIQMCVRVVDTFSSYTNKTHDTPSDQMRTTQNPRRTSAPPPPPILQF